jgi:hypothetical protein
MPPCGSYVLSFEFPEKISACMSNQYRWMHYLVMFRGYIFKQHWTVFLLQCPFFVKVLVQKMGTARYTNMNVPSFFRSNSRLPCWEHWCQCHTFFASVCCHWNPDICSFKGEGLLKLTCYSHSAIVTISRSLLVRRIWYNSNSPVSNVVDYHSADILLCTGWW